MATFVLVHGAFQGAWVWQKVSILLQEQGHIVHTPTLTNCGYLFTKNRVDIDLGSYIADISRYLEFEDINDCVLAGHSYSGMICGAVMMQLPQRIRQMVFIDAMIPESGCSFADIAGEPFQQMLQRNRMEHDQVKPWPVEVFGVGPDDAPWFTTRLRPFPLQAFHSPFPGDFDPTILPASLITCTKTASPFIRAMAAKAARYSWPVDVLDSGHCPMVTNPEDLAAILASRAQ
ncbi:MAG: alpha/beta hydrolase [Desulfobulbaceae bacterium]|nr:alpha/beta hydrolase [Desulfobulbaceae bacterium]